MLPILVGQLELLFVLIVPRMGRGNTSCSLVAPGARVFVACGHIGQVNNFFINRFISVLVRPFDIATGTGFNNHMLLLIRAV